MFKLPSPFTLRSWVNSVNIKTGLSEDMFCLLETKVKTMNPEDRVCALYVEEMSLKSCLNYHFNHDCIYGFTDIGKNNKSSAIANSVFSSYG